MEAKLVEFAAREAGDAVRVSKTMALINLWIDPKLGALPQPQASEQRHVKGLARFADAGQTLGALIGRTERGVALVNEGTLTVQAEDVCRGRGRLLVTIGAPAGADWLPN